MEQSHFRCGPMPALRWCGTAAVAAAVVEPTYQPEGDRRPTEHRRHIRRPFYFTFWMGLQKVRGDQLSTDDIQGGHFIWNFNRWEGNERWHRKPTKKTSPIIFYKQRRQTSIEPQSRSVSYIFQESHARSFTEQTQIKRNYLKIVALYHDDKQQSWSSGPILF